MLLLKNTSIRQRLTYIIMSISCISVLLTTLAISIIGIYNLRASIRKDLEVSASIAGDRNAAALAFNLSEDAERNLGVFSVKTSIVQACLYQQNGVLFAKYLNKKYEDKAQCTEDLSQRITMGDSRIELVQPIYQANDRIGFIYIESTLEQIDAYIEKQTTIALSVIGAGLLVSYLLAINLQKAISRPILRLADTARQISVHKDFSIRATPIGNSKAEYNNELVILTDSFNTMLQEIGERDRQLKLQYTELEKAKDAAESANRAKSQFLANISHELRTPLNAIIGFSSILMNQLFGPLGDKKYWEYAKDINESGAHLLDIINDILDLSKAEAGKLTLNYEEVHVGKSVNKCLTILAEMAEKGKITITADVPKMLPPLVADRLRFIQILLNVLSNAIKFTPEGGKVNLSVRMEDPGKENSNFIFAIQDTGIGMAPADIAKAFQSFGQVDSGLNRKYEGTGLGLPLTKRLVDLHYGKIDLQSELGKGTLVTITFPALPPAEANYTPND